MIEVKNITKSFDGRVVLKDISTTFEDGKTNLIIGRRTYIFQEIGRAHV